MKSSLSYYLCSYDPLCSSDKGLAAIQAHGIDPYVDHSSRREPDLENPNPSITTLCRSDKFAPRLNIGDIVAYITTGTHKLTAILQIVNKMNNHKEAHKWYQQRGFEIPSNCVIRPPIQSGFTGKSCDVVATDEKLYKDRAADNSTFLICRVLFLELNHPPSLEWKKIKEIGTRNPSNKHTQKLKKMLAPFIKSWKSK